MIFHGLLKSHLFFPLILFLLKLSFSETRFVDPVFTKDDFSEITGIIYTKAAGNSISDLKMDLIMPSFERDPLKKRPCMVMMHGGGFIAGDRTSWQVTDFNEYLASLGYVCVSIDYTLGNGRDSVFFRNAIIYSCDDLNSAVSYLISNSNKYNIDTSKIMAGGFSAGAVASLHYAYLDKNEALIFKETEGYPDESLNNFITRDKSRVKAVVNFWGCIGDPSWLENEQTPVFSIHGKSDRVVNFSCGRIYGSDDMPVCCGGRIIQKSAQKNKIKSRLSTFSGGHGEVNRFKLKRIYKEIADFLYNNVLR